MGKVFLVSGRIMCLFPARRNVMALFRGDEDGIARREDVFRIERNQAVLGEVLQLLLAEQAEYVLLGDTHVRLVEQPFCVLIGATPQAVERDLGQGSQHVATPHHFEMPRAHVQALALSKLRQWEQGIT